MSTRNAQNISILSIVIWIYQIILLSTRKLRSLSLIAIILSRIIVAASASSWYIKTKKQTNKMITSMTMIMIMMPMTMMWNKKHKNLSHTTKQAYNICRGMDIMFDRKYKQYQLQMKINQITKQDKIQQMNQSLQFDMDSQSVIIPYFFVTDAVYQGCEDTFGDLPPPNHIFSGYHHLCRLHIKIYSQYQKQNQLKQYIQCQQKCTQSYALSKNPKYIFNPMSVFQIKKLKKYQKQGDIFEMCLSFQNSIPISTFSPPAQIKNLDKQILDKYQQNLLKMGVGYRQDILNNGDVYCMLGRFYSYDYYFQAEKYFREQLARQQKSKIKINSNFFYYMKLCCIANQIHSTIKIIQYGRQLQKFINQKQFLGLAYVYIGVSRYHEKKYQQAIQFYEKAKNYQNNYQKNGRRIIMNKDLLVTVHNNLAMAHFALENLKESEQQFQQALRIAKKQFGQHSINYLTVEINRIKAQFTDGPDAKDLYEDIQFECSGLGAIDAYTGCHYEVAYLLLKTLEYNIDIPLQNLLQNFNGQLKKQSTEKILNQQRIRKLQKVRSLQKKIYGRISLQLAKTMLKLSKCYPIKIDKKSNAGKEQKSPLSTFGQDYLNASLEIVLQLLKNQKEVRVDEMYLLLEDIGNAYKKYFLIQDALEVYKICQEAYTKNNSNRLKQVQSIIHELNRKLAWSNKQ